MKNLIKLGRRGYNCESILQQSTPCPYFENMAIQLFEKSVFSPSNIHFIQQSNKKF